MNGLTKALIAAATDTANKTGQPQVIRRTAEGNHIVEERVPGPVPLETVMVVYPEQK